MDSVLFRRLQKLAVILNRKQSNQWRRQQFKAIYTGSQVYYKIRNNNNRTEVKNEMSAQQRPAIGRICLGNTKAKFRYWDPAHIDLEVKDETDPQFKPKGLPFKIVSYNILAQDLILEHLPCYRLANQLHLKWSYRFPKLIDEIVAQKPSVICLQEVQENHLGDIAIDIRAKLPMSFVFKKKTGFRTDGCAIFYDTNLFELVISDFVEFYQPACDRLDRHNIALLAKLRCKSNPEMEFLVCTTHLLYNPGREDVRLAQTVVLLAELDRHSVVGTTAGGELQRMPIILTGDFNFQPDSAPFELIVTGKLDYEQLWANTLNKYPFGRGQPFGKNLIASRLGITDHCQHFDCVNSNYRDDTTRLYRSCDETKHFPFKPPSKLSSRLFSTGTLTHGRNFKSVYNHTADTYGSTYQRQWITPDHLFFSEAARENCQKGSIKLLSVYQLPSVQQCRELRCLPSADLGSDHLMLASYFYLAFPEG